MADRSAPEPRIEYRRVLLKLSGEALDSVGDDSEVLHLIAREVKSVRNAGIDIAIVVGGGNIVRGVQMAERTRVARVTADYMGLLATVINALALQDAMEQEGLETRVQTALEMRQVAEPYIRRRAIRHLEKGRIVIFAGGTGSPRRASTACTTRIRGTTPTPCASARWTTWRC